MEAVKQSGWALRYAAAELQADKEVVLEAVKKSGWALQYAAAELQAGKEVVLEAVKQDGYALYYAAAELKADKAFVLEAVKQNGSALEHAAAELQADKAVVLEAVKQSGGALQYAAAELQADKKVVLEAVKQSGGALQYAAAELQADKAVVQEAVKQNGGALRYAAAELQADKAVVLEAIKQSGGALQHAAAELQADKEVVLEAVKQSGGALTYAAAEFKADNEVVLEAVKRNGGALRYAAAELKADKEVVLEAVKQDGWALQHAAAELQADKEVVLEAVKQSGGALTYAAAGLQADNEVVLEAVKQDGDALYYAAAELQADKEVVLEAVKQNGGALEYASAELQADEEILLAAVKGNRNHLKYVSGDFIEQNGYVLFDVEESHPLLQSDRAFLLAAVHYNDSVSEVAAEELKEEIRIEAAKQAAAADKRATEGGASAKAFTALELVQEQSALFDLRRANRSVLSITNNATEGNSSNATTPALVDLLRQLAADSSKQQKASERLARLVKLDQNFTATDAKVVTTMTSASNGCAVDIVSTETVQQQSAKIQECLDAFDAAQTALKKAARTFPTTPAELPVARAPSDDDPLTAQPLAPEVAATVRKRDEARSHFCQHFGTFQSRWKEHLIIRLGYLLERLGDLRNARDAFAAGRNHDASCGGTPVRPLPDVLEDAIATFDAWRALVKEECKSTTASTDQAFADLGEHLSTTLSRGVRGEATADDSGRQLAAVQEKLQIVATNVRTEKEYWASDPLDSLPYDCILAAGEQIIQSFKAEAAATELVLQQMERWSPRAKELRRMPRCPTDLESFFALEEAVLDLNDDFQEQQGKVKRMKQRAGGASRRRSENQSKLAATTELAAKIHEDLRAAGATFQAEKKRLKDLTKNHYPELAVQFPDADLLGIADLDGLVDSSITFESFGDGGSKEKLGSNGRHAVFKAFLNGAPVVLKKFDLENESDASKFKKEARKLKGLAHPSIINLESVILEEHAAYIHLAYQPGGDLQAWLTVQTPTAVQKQALLHQVCRGIEYLHANEILHCDIKLENILMTEASSSARPMLADFDISKDVEERALQTQTAAATAVGGGTFIYMAPEIKPRIAGGKGERQTPRSDMYAFGVAGLLVFSKSCRDSVDADGGDANDVLDARVSDAQRETQLLVGIDRDVPDAARLTMVPLLAKLLSQEPAHRLSAADAVNDPALAVDIVVRELAAQREAAAAEAAEQKQALKVERDQAREEIIARNREAYEKARALERDCCICFDSFPVQDGVECSAPDGADTHFVCNECFSGHVSEESTTEDLGALAQRQGDVFCPYRQHGCADSPAYTDAEVAQHTSVDAFECYTQGKRKLLEMQLVQEIGAAEKQKFEAELERLMQMDEQQREVRRHIQVLDGVMNLKCPRSDDHIYGVLPPDWDFQSECLALKCQHEGCGCKFCGWCGQDCGNEAHAHVALCGEKPGGQGLFYSTREIWEEHRKGKLATKIRTYLDGIDNAEVRTEVALGQSGLLAEIGVSVHNYLPN